MADEGARPSCSVETTTSSPSIEEETTSAAVVSGETSRAGWSDVTRIYLFEQYQKWCALKEELKLKMDKELAAVLLEFYIVHKKQVFR
jgi:hypothetical protein